MCVCRKGGEGIFCFWLTLWTQNNLRKLIDNQKLTNFRSKCRRKKKKKRRRRRNKQTKKKQINNC